MGIFPSLCKRQVVLTKKVFSLVLLLGLIVQPIAPSLFMSGFFISKAQAADESTAVASVDEEDVIDEAEEVETESVEEVAPTEEITTPEAPVVESETSEVVTNEKATEEETTLAVEEEKKEVSVWQTEREKAVTTGPVELGVKYEAPQNKEVTVTFTKLPSTPGTLTIEEITLTKEQVAATGSLSDKAYDITSSMENGSFEYELTLPIPEGKENVQVLYADKVENLNEAKVVKEEDVKTEGDSIKAELNHFTVFVTVVGTYDASLSLSKNIFAQGEIVGVKAEVSFVDGLLGFPYHRIDVLDPNGVSYSVVSCSTSETLSGSYNLPVNAEIGSDWKVKVSRGYSDITNCNNEFLPLDPIFSTQVNFEVQSRVITQSATDITPVDATLNGTNTGSAVTNHSFWVSTSSFPTVSPTIPAGVHSTQVLGPLPAGQNFSVPLSLLTTNAHNGDNIPTITPNTTYYFAAWVEVGGIWYPGEVKSFTTGSIPACSGSSSFDGFNIGSVNGQGGWSATGPFDQAVVHNIYNFPTLGCKTLRISNSITSGSFGDQVFAAPVLNAAGESSATAGSFSVGTRQNRFEAEFDIASALPTEQVGMSVSISPDRGDGSRMSYLRFEDTTGGIDVFFDDYNSTDGFVETQVADNLSRTAPHTIKFAMDFVEGAANDVVEIYIDGNLVKTGTSWEDYYRDTASQAPEQNPRLVKTLLIREAGSANVANSGKGFLYDNFNLSSSTVTPPDTTPPAKPTGLKWQSVDRLTTYACGASTQIQPLVPDWDDVTGDPTFSHYEYTSFTPDGNIGLNEQVFTASEFPNTWMPSAGTFGYAVRSVDTADNKSDWALLDKTLAESCQITFDSTTPTQPVFTAPANNLITNVNSVTLNWTGGGDTGTSPSGIKGYTVRYTFVPMGGGATINWSSALITSGNPQTHSGTYGHGQGTYTVYVSTTDNAGNVSPESVARVLTYDATAPDVAITAPTGGYVNGTVAIRGSVTDANPHHYYLVVKNSSNVVIAGPGTVNDTTSFTDKLLYNWNTTGLPEGVYKIQLEARDAATNKDTGSVVTQIVTIDRTAPTVNLEFPTAVIGSSSANSFQAVFSEDVNEAEAENGANYFLNNWPGADGTGDLVGDVNITYDASTRTATIQMIDPNWFVSAEQEWGVKNIHDLAGNLQVVNPYSETSTLNLSPVTTDSGTDTSWHSADVTVTLACNDGPVTTGSGCKTTYYTTDGSVPTMSSAQGTSILVGTEGENIINYFSVDYAGNVEGSKEAANTVKIDKTAPTVTYSIDPNTPNGDNNWYISESQVTLSADDGVLSGVAQIEYRLNGGGWNPYTGPFALTDGTWTIEYRASDVAGNTSVPESASAKVDTQDPDEVSDLEAEYRGAPNNDIKLDWNIDDNDIDKVYIYRGGSRDFDINSENRKAINDANDETYSHNNPTFGATYYYKLVSVDEAGNRSGARVIKVEMPAAAGGTATVTDEGTDAVPEGTVLGAQTEEGQEGNNDQEGAQVNQDGSVLGATDENGDTNGIMDFIKKYSWWWLIILLIIGYTSYRYYVAKKENQNPLV